MERPEQEILAEIGVLLREYNITPPPSLDDYLNPPITLSIDSILESSSEFERSENECEVPIEEFEVESKISKINKSKILKWVIGGLISGTTFFFNPIAGITISLTSLLILLRNNKGVKK